MTRFTLVLVFTVQAIFAGKAPEIQDSLRFSVPSNPRLSPDGSSVVWQASRTNYEDNTFESELWISRTAPPFEQRRIAAVGWNGDAQWSADSKKIAFISDRGGKRQIYVAAIGARDIRRITSFDAGVNEFRWSPDAQSFAFTSDEDTDRGGDFEVVNAPHGPHRLWRVGLESGSKPAEIAPDKDYSAMGFSWSPDGSRIAFQSDAIYSLELSTCAIKKLASGSGPYRDPVWSPLSDYVAFETADGDPGFYYSNWHVARVAAVGGPVEILTRDFDENADLVAWTSAGIYFGGLQKTGSALFLVDPNAKTHRQVTTAGAAASQFSVTSRGDRFGYIDSASDRLPELILNEAVQITHTSAQIEGFTLARRELVRWRSSDGTPVEGVLLKPADFDPSKRYPLMVVIHGGPVAVDQPVVKPDRTYPLEQFVARGALVLKPNYRGSAGYGAKFRSLAVRNLGIGDAADIVSGVDSLIARGFVDPARVGAMGWSEGGYVAAFVATYTDRFRAVSVGAGVSDWLTYYVNTDITPFTRQYLKATPWDDPAIYREASPITYVSRAKTPVLIQHGDQDRRVPIPNAYELRQALEDRNVPVKMIVYKGFGHSIDRPRQQQAAMQHNLDWFSEWILDGPGQPKKDSPQTTVSQAGSDPSAGGLQ